MGDQLTIDGSMGEGGGQILRSALSLSLITGRPFTMTNIRKGRKKPGLMRQHLACVHAAAEIGGARVTGDEAGSLQVSFVPDVIRSGKYAFSIGTAGSCTLLLQTVLPALASVSAISELKLNGGTHNPLAPPFDFLSKSFLPLLARLGAQVKANLVRPGFYPAGGGELLVRIEPGLAHAHFELVERGNLVGKTARILFANLPFHIIERERRTIMDAMGFAADQVKLEERHDSAGPGNAVSIQIESEHVTEVFTSFGERGRSAEKVAGEVSEGAHRYLASKAAVGEYLADQLLLPLAMNKSGRFTTNRVSRHATTQMDIIQIFLERSFRREQVERDLWLIELRV